MREDRELEQYRQLLLAPTEFHDGFSMKSVVGCIFIGLVMMPGSMYLALLAGGTLGPAAQWVTMILFIELARRSFTQLKSPEIFILYYMAGLAVVSPFSSLLFTQYFVQSSAAKAFGIAPLIPRWVAPAPAILRMRTFFVRQWLPPIALLTVTYLFSRLNNFGLGYVLFRITSDVERLPFPMAPIGALGITALAESSSGEQTWKWRVFSIGGMMGLIFGFFYIGVPAITGTFLKTPIQIIPIPFSDFTLRTETILPGVPMAISYDLTNVLVGMVLPFSAVLGSFLGMLATWIINPILHSYHQLPSWRPGMDAIDTSYQDTVDCYLSIGIGLSIAIAVIGFYHVFSSIRRRERNVALEPTPLPMDESAAEGAGRKLRQTGWQRLMHPPATRGDFSLWIGLGIYLFSTVFYTALCKYLVPGFPLWILLGYGFIYTPIISYVAARMEGIAGQWVDIPMVQQATFILAHRFGYNGVGIWFAPIPLNNFAGQVVAFRTQELTGTKFSSVIKAELVLFPVVTISSIIFSQYLWRIAPIPSPAYPYVEQYWNLQARITALYESSTIPGGNSTFLHAIKWWYIGGSAAVGIVSYWVLSMFGAPLMLAYGLVRGLGSTLAAGMIPQMFGALLGKYYFEKRFGITRWREYAPVLTAGFACGIGLISMLSFGFELISKAVFQLPY